MEVSSTEWTVPGWLEEGSDYTVRVRSVDDTSIKDYSDNTFTIAAAMQAQNYPNPFNPETTIRYILPQAGHVEIGVYDMLGQKVAQLVSQSQNAGTHQVRFEAGHLGSGYYFYRIQAGAHTLKRQVLLLK